MSNTGDDRLSLVFFLAVFAKKLLCRAKTKLPHGLVFSQYRLPVS